MKKTKMIFNVVAWAYFNVKVDNNTGRVYMKQKTTIDTNNLTNDNVKFKMNCHIDDFKKYVENGLFIQCDDIMKLSESYNVIADEETRNNYMKMYNKGRENQIKKILKTRGIDAKINVQIVERDNKEDNDND